MALHPKGNRRGERTLRLTRSDKLITGVFGVLTTDDLTVICQTLEHAYPSNTSPITYSPKIPPGIYTCVRGMHQLEGMTQPFETFEITNVPGHTNILFHSGNTNNDSAGCVLLGQQRLANSEILGSRLAFAAFMDKLKYIDSFQLTVS